MLYVMQFDAAMGIHGSTLMCFIRDQKKQSNFYWLLVTLTEELCNSFSCKMLGVELRLKVR